MVWHVGAIKKTNNKEKKKKKKKRKITKIIDIPSSWKKRRKKGAEERRKEAWFRRDGVDLSLPTTPNDLPHRKINLLRRSVRRFSFLFLFFFSFPSYIWFTLFRTTPVSGFGDFRHRSRYSASICNWAFAICSNLFR